ncbi:cell division suppressor protein YneA [Metabacillus indicus]|uniref:cell division suppressor protein YneA n=1 Tax=Metabacillus indicus TaxID=246786 RepID=UPI00317F4B15
MKGSLSYVISFFAVVIVAVFALSYTGEKESLDHYVSIEIAEGDSIWSLADQYEEHHRMSKTDFVEWVQDKNGLPTAVIKSGDSVVLPIEKQTYHDGTQLASRK